LAYIPTSISAAVGDKELGKPAANKADDVKKVQALLRKVLASACPAFADGVCDDKTKEAISTFQRLWLGTPDGTVSRGGQTLKRLDRLANPLMCKNIAMGSVANGGYVVSYATCDTGPLPAAGKGHTLHLCFPNEKHSVDVTGRPPGDLLSKDNLGLLLALFEKLDVWGTPVECRVQLRYGSDVISTSNPQTLKAPVRPHNGKMLPLDETGNGSKLTYQGDPDTKDFHGRMFAKVAGYDKYVFIWAGRFETDPAFRGFDCITYAGTTCGASTFHMADSADLATSLGAAVVEHNTTVKDAKTSAVTPLKVKLDNATPAHVKEFFAANATGTYLMWSSGHIVLVVEGTVHEFKASAPSGYRATPVATWLEPYESKKLTVRKLAGKPALAV
jgi:hypothetical protein